MREGFRDSVECYETVTTKKEKITVTNKGQVKYGLFPVWFLNTKWNGQTYSFAMNGQTGTSDRGSSCRKNAGSQVLV